MNHGRARYQKHGCRCEECVAGNYSYLRNYRKRERYKEYHRRWLREKAKRYNDYKATLGGCSLCGYSKCVAALDFHHVEEDGKDRGIGVMATGNWEKLMEEIDKCVLVCANCHREIHDKERNEVTEDIIL